LDFMARDRLVYRKRGVVNDDFVDFVVIIIFGRHPQIMRDLIHRELASPDRNTMAAEA
jgi:hypothetical protein